MALPNLLSRRRRALEGKTIDVYSYDEAPPKLRVQLILIIKSALGPYTSDQYGYGTAPAYNYIIRTLREETGLTRLSVSLYNDDAELYQWMHDTKSVPDFYDAVDICLQMLNTHIRSFYEQHKEFSSRSPDGAISDVNARLKEAGVGYEFVDGQLIQYSNEHLHAELIVPALQLISNPSFAAVNEEYREAHAAYRAGDYETCLADAGKAFESTLKVLAAKLSWPVAENDSASKLISAAFSSGFLPAWMQTQFTSLKSLLESGVPTLRNKQSSHGAGTLQRVVPKELAEFQLYQTAAVIVFLVRHDESKAE